MDTPDRNVPEFIPQDFFVILFSILEKLNPEQIRVMVAEGINMRLNTTNLTIPKLVAEAARRNMTIEEVIAMPEKEEYTYSNGKNYICSSIVVKYLKEAGIFDGLNIESPEFTPYDVYMLKIYDTENLPKICQEKNPELPFCLLAGKYLIDPKGYNSIIPYSHMNERCPSAAPHYERPDNC